VVIAHGYAIFTSESPFYIFLQCIFRCGSDNILALMWTFSRLL